MNIRAYEQRDQEAVLKLIVEIQRKEYNIQINLDDQPDLFAISKVYQVESGGFWVAYSGTELVGTIALLPLTNPFVSLRKMFVKKAYRGQKFGVAQQLLETVFKWCIEKNCEVIFLGTTDKFGAAHCFYEKNNFEPIVKSELPVDFPVLKVDSVFSKYKLK